MAILEQLKPELRKQSLDDFLATVSGISKDKFPSIDETKLNLKSKLHKYKAINKQ